MATIHNYPIVLPQPGSAGPGIPSVSMIAKCVVTADTTLSSDQYNILLDAGDSDRDIPLFVMPSGTMIEDIGFEITQVWTESVGIKLGDCDDSNGFADTVWLVSTVVTTAAGLIKWASMSGITAELESSAKIDSTAARMAYLKEGPRCFFANSDDTGDSTVTGLDTDVFELGKRYAINMYVDGAVVATGTTHFYIKYNFSYFQLPAMASDYGLHD